MGTRKMRSPAQEARAELMEEHGRRGNAKVSLWLTQDPRTKKDLVLVGDPRHEHFYACEGDPKVVDVDYEPPELRFQIGGRPVAVSFDARVVYDDGRIELRIVGDFAPHSGAEAASSVAYDDTIEAARRLGGTYRRITLSDLDLLRQRISNWRRVLRCLRACAQVPLGPEKLAIRTYLQQHRRCTVGQLLEHFDDSDPSITLGAIAALLHARVLQSNLDTELWSRHTRLCL